MSAPAFPASAVISDDALGALTRCDDDEEMHTSRKSANVRTWRPDAFVTRAMFDRFVSTCSAPGAPSRTNEDVFVVDGETPHAPELREWAGRGFDVRAVGRWPIVRGGGVTVRWFQPWAGRAVTMDEAAVTWRAVVEGCHRFGSNGPLTSPGVTGVDLWQRTIGEGVEYPVPNRRLATFLRDTSSQGRVELLPPITSLIPAVYEYDSRLAYLGCLAELPAGSITVDRMSWSVPYRQLAADLDPYTAARLLIVWRAPEGWHRAGIFRAERSPTNPRAFPIEGGPAWADHAEVRLADRFGWSIDVLAIVRWSARCSPFRRWADTLRRVMATEPAGVPRDVWRAVWRSVALQSIGSLHGSPTTYRRFGAEGAAHKEPRAGRADLAHPEWTSAIWTRARLRLLDAPGAGGGERVGAWHLPAPVVLGFRTDALYTTQPTGWADDGRIGRYRLKRAGGPRSWPLIESQLLEGLNDV